jgi:hypothetical protein
MGSYVMMCVLGQIQPVELVTGKKASVAAMDATYVVAGAFLATLAVLAAVFWLFRKQARDAASPREAAWNALAARTGLTRAQRRLIARMAGLAGMEPCSIILSRHAMEMAVLRTASLLARAELQAAVSKVWSSVEVPGAAGQLPTVKMPEIRPPVRMRPGAGPKMLPMQAKGNSKVRISA